MAKGEKEAKKWSKVLDQMTAEELEEKLNELEEEEVQITIKHNQIKSTLEIRRAKKQKLEDDN